MCCVAILTLYIVERILRHLKMSTPVSLSMQTDLENRDMSP